MCSQTQLSEMQFNRIYGWNIDRSVKESLKVSSEFLIIFHLCLYLLCEW